MQIRASDKVGILAGGSLSLRLLDGGYKELSGPRNLELLEGGTTEVPWVPSDLLKLAQALFQPAAEGEIAEARIRGDDTRTITLPLIEPAGAALLPGPHHLALDLVRRRPAL